MLLVSVASDLDFRRKTSITAPSVGPRFPAQLHHHCEHVAKRNLRPHHPPCRRGPHDGVDNQGHGCMQSLETDDHPHTSLMDRHPLDEEYQVPGALFGTFQWCHHQLVCLPGSCPTTTSYRLVLCDWFSPRVASYKDQTHAHPSRGTHHTPCSAALAVIDSRLTRARFDGLDGCLWAFFTMDTQPPPKSLSPFTPSPFS